MITNEKIPSREWLLGWFDCWYWAIPLGWNERKKRFKTYTREQLWGMYKETKGMA